MKTETNRALEALNRLLDEADSKLVSFSERLSVNPGLAFESADGAFRAAATREVVGRFRRLLADGVASFEDLVAELTADLLSSARRRDDRSTSSCSNEYARCALSVRAELLEELRRAGRGL